MQHTWRSFIYALFSVIFFFLMYGKKKAYLNGSCKWGLFVSCTHPHPKKKKAHLCLDHTILSNMHFIPNCVHYSHIYFKCASHPNCTSYLKCAFYPNQTKRIFQQKNKLISILFEMKCT